MSVGAAEEEAGPAETGRALQGLGTGAAREQVGTQPWWPRLQPKAGTTRSGGQIRNRPNSGHIHDWNSGLGQTRAYAGMALVNGGDFWEPGWS